MSRRSPRVPLLWVSGLIAAALLIPTARSCGGDEQAQPAAQPAAHDEGHSLEWAKKRAAELGGGVRPEDVMGARLPEADLFSPDRRETNKPALGGRIIVHLEAFPANLNKAIENSAVVTFMLNEMHDSLLQYNWATWKNDLELAKAMWVEDQVVLKDGSTLMGKLKDQGESWLLTSGCPHNPQAEKTLAKADVAKVLGSTIYTFDLREGVTWHDGHPFDAADVLFSYQTYCNPHVDCDEVRFQFDEVKGAELLGKNSIRFTFKQPYFKSEALFTDTLFLLPRHLYDLSDPDNKDYDPKATPEKQGAYVNDNPHNIQFVGLGPYKLKEWAQNQFIEAERYPGYWQHDPAVAGYVDLIRWRYLDNDDSAFQAVLNGELDIFRRLKTEDYFGEGTQKPVFTDNYYKAYTYTQQYGYTTWNLYRDKLKDVRVRQALAHAFDSKGWVQTKYMGLAVPVTGPAFFLSPFYNHDVPLLAYDPALAEEMLADADWYDRNGDGNVDKDGQELTIEFLMPSGNKASEAYGQKLQESFGKVGVKVTIQALEWASFLERILNRDFDCANLAWVMYDPESDPTQLWHSSYGKPAQRSSNHAGLMDPEVDRIIDTLKMEPDVDKRIPLWHQLHARIYELQPYLFGQTPPTKYTFSRKLHGVRLYTASPGYRLREMYFEEGTPGTRPLNRN
jgi:peptide/nickel transport system substrate-binding protein